AWSSRRRLTRGLAGSGRTRAGGCSSPSGRPGRSECTIRRRARGVRGPPPGGPPQAYAVYVDETDAVWLTDFGGNAIVRFDPVSERFTSFPLPSEGAAGRQLLGLP